ncbi:MAG: 4-(cytidine 5'-diphospho)-2-C-methyl-D-erythritol kinase [bacterium]|nr:4-(cytidine 5'-diphospho)-2-C-methyl-D-erythritol kinase [bacterium]
MSAALTLISHAKINLYLDVLTRRRDGFHNIETIFQTVDLADRLVIEARPDGISMECSDAELECGPGNLVYRAAELLQAATGCTRGAHLSLEKRIPVAAGLAGGSGDAAAALIGLDRLWRTGLSQVQLHRLALELGSDVPYCLEGGTMAATGRGDRLYEMTPLPETWFVLVHPAIAVSTRAVYTSPDLRRNETRPFAGRTAELRKAIAALRVGAWDDVLANSMQDVVFGLYPELADIRDGLLEAGCQAAMMSGSGPTVFGVCGSKDEAGAVAKRLAPHATTAVRSVDRGVEFASD